MTLRLGGNGRTSLAALASLTLAATLACGAAMTGCGGDNNPVTAGDGGPDSSLPVEAGPDGQVPDQKVDSPVLAQCTTPTLTPAGGAVAAGTAVTVAAAGLPANGFIFYTTDGTLPTHGSLAVMAGGTITVNASETIHAIAYAMGACSDSAPLTATYTVAVSDAGPDIVAPTQCGMPTITPNGGAILVGSTISITPPTGFPTNFPAGNAFVYYTTDGTVPTHLSSAYSGPIQINTNESIRAIAYYQGVCVDSGVALATFTVTQPEAGTLVSPAFNPTATTRNNDFLVSLSEASTPSATICFTLGAGTTAPAPTCTVTAAAAICTGTSQTYNAGAGLGAAGSVTINGGVTDGNGNVSVNAIACAPGSTTTAAVVQQYKLQAAAPTMQGPAPSTTLPYVSGGYNPTLASPTTGSSLRYNSYATGAAPALDCTTGTLLVNVAAQGINPGPLPVAQNITYQGVACKAGYAPSPVAPFAYQIVLDAPTFVKAGTVTPEGAGTYDRVVSINVAGDGAPGLYACYTTNGAAPACAAAANMCATGSTPAVVGGMTPTAIAVATTATTVNAVACSPSFDASTAASALYTLQLDPPALDAPGCTTATTPSNCVTAGALAPILSYGIPASMVTFTPHIEEFIGTGVGTHPGYQFACVANGATPSCSPTGCATGNIIAGSMANFQTANTVSLGTAVAAGDSWSIIGCPGTTASPGFAPSAVTTVVFSGPGQAVAPSISPATSTSSGPIVPSITNQGIAGLNICYTTDGTTPTCTGGTCQGTATTLSSVAVIGTTTVSSVAVTAGGSGYTSPPTVTLSAPVGTGTQAAATATLGFSVASLAITAAGTHCIPNPTVTFTGASTTPATATATVDLTNTIIALTVTSGGSGYVAAPTVTITGCTAATATAALNPGGSVTSVAVTAPGGSGYSAAPTVSFTGGGGSGATATASIGTLPGTSLLTAMQANPTSPNTSLNAIACSAASGSSPVVSATYTFVVATPTVVDTTRANASVVNGSTVPIGDTIKFASSSTFTGSGTPLSICYTTDGSAPTCACATGTSVANGATLVTTGTSFATNTLQAIACNTAALQTASAVYTASLNLPALTPVATPPGGNYLSAQNVSLASTAGTTICYTTTPGATPTCNAGTCTNGSATYSAPIPVTQTGTVIKAVSCSASLMSPVSAGDTYTLSVAPIVLTNNPTNPAVCPVTPSTNDVTIGFDCGTFTLAGGVNTGGSCSTATHAAGGPTAGIGGTHPIICYSTDGSAVSACLTVGVHGSITCFDAGATGTGTASLALTATTTIHALGCLAGTGIALNNASATLPVTFTPFTDPTITVDGVITDWTAADEAVAENSAATGLGYFTYTGSTLYFAVNGQYTPAATTYVGFYIGNGVAAGAAPAGRASLGTPALSSAAGIRYTFQWPTDNSAPPAAYVWNAGGGTWDAAGFVPTVMSVGSVAEFSIPLASLPNLGVTLGAPATVVTVIGSEVTGVGTAPLTGFTFPGGATAVATMGVKYADWFTDVLNTCSDPAAQIH
jgi:hypothetical protein